MSQSLSQLYVHLVFSPKDRAPVLHPTFPRGSMIILPEYSTRLTPRR